ncbi:MAG: hypothetical protein ICV51_01515 [Flavisolibacter sp.]|nr:hypothetical protein [Flavisolibacter sp.]
MQLIQSMIDKAKANISENRFYFLLWGWLTFIAILTQFLLKVVLQYKHHYLVWLCIFPAIIITIIRNRQRERHRYRTYVGESMSYLWTGIGISFFVLSFIVSKSSDGWLYAYPFFILFYGLGTFVSGKILQFRPLVAGGIFNWLLAIVSIYVHFDYQLLIAAAAILTSYIIPGYLLQFKKNNYLWSKMNNRCRMKKV